MATQPSQFQFGTNAKRGLALLAGAVGLSLAIDYWDLDRQWNALFLKDDIDTLALNATRGGQVEDEVAAKIVNGAAASAAAAPPPPATK